ncbi:GBS Bsp-like repeat-containing protein [Eubacteriaceae bacterium ES3]|nr:GBS Bsp-like repeat-containing protein [Eubacteriaceae bacterium ES3]
MKNTGLKRLCLGTALVLMLGFAPSAVLANESNTEDTAVQTTVAQKTFFTPRLTQPTSDNPYFYANNRYYQGGYGLPNCTAYAYGRAYEILGYDPGLPMNDAGGWWSDNMASGTYAYGSTPKLGAIICWNGSYYGHVAVVEAINGDQVTVSESAWSGPIFNSYTYTIGNENNTSVGGFQGYIYVGDFVDASTDTVKPTIENVRVSEVDDEGFTVTAEVSDADTGISKITIPVWTDAGGQDDRIWYDGSLDGNTVTCRVEYADHNNEQGDYSIHLYAYDYNGNQSLVTTHTSINTVYPTITDVGDLLTASKESDKAPPVI